MPVSVPAALARTGLYATLCGWGALTVMKQVNRGNDLLRRVDPFNVMIPNYRFFGPTPAMHDLHVLVRDKPLDGPAGQWREISVAEDRRPWHLVWAPFRRLHKGLYDAARDLLSIARRGTELDRLKATIPYNALLNLTVHGVSHEPDAQQTQFAIGRSAVYEPTEPLLMLFASDFHDLTAGHHRNASVTLSGFRP